MATDGCGLRGSTTVIINISDQNDMPPKFHVKQWLLELDEKEIASPSKEPILVLSVSDGDLLTTNQFVYKIRNDSALSSYFNISTNPDGSGRLTLTKPLVTTRGAPQLFNNQGFNLTISVSDSSGFSSHIDNARVFIRIRDKK